MYIVKVFKVLVEERGLQGCKHDSVDFEEKEITEATMPEITVCMMESDSSSTIS